MGSIDFPMVFINQPSRHLIHQAYFKSQSSMVWLSFSAHKDWVVFCCKVFPMDSVGIMLASRHELIWTLQEDFGVRLTPEPPKQIKQGWCFISLFMFLNVSYLDWLLVPSRSGNTKKMHGAGDPRTPSDCAVAEWYSTCDFFAMRPRYSCTERYLFLSEITQPIHCKLSRSETGWEVNYATANFQLSNQEPLTFH